MSATTHTKPGAYGVGHVVTAADLRDALADLGFSLRQSSDFDPAERQLSIRHPQEDALELVVVINVDSVWRKDEAYTGVNVFTLVRTAPFNVIGHPLNIVVGLSQVHDLAMFSNIVKGIAIRFRGIDVDDEVRNWYTF